MALWSRKGKSAPSATGGAREAVPAVPRHKRFLTDQHERYAAYIKAAKTYLDQVGSSADDWLFQKPYDRLEDHREFFTLTYNVLNLLQAMRIPAKGRILEVGAGAGWLTEILMSLRYEVYALEPSEAMQEVARQRIAGCIEHHRFKDVPPVHYLCEALEECSLPDESVDAVIFHEALHHVVDEERGIAQCFRVLSPDGLLGVTGEGTWIPGDRNLESACEEEMARYGTLENPYTFDYLKYLLTKHGFDEITRYHGINGFFPEAMGQLPLKQLAQAPAQNCNHITARKPLALGATTANQKGVTRGRIRVVEAKVDPANGRLAVRVELTNSGHTAWLHRQRAAGWVSLSLYRGNLGSADFAEAYPRSALPKTVLAGQSVQFEASFAAPAGGWAGSWHIDLVNEGHFWFNLHTPVKLAG
jgi:SAM-dependent methyltransferase